LAAIEEGFGSTELPYGISSQGCENPTLLAKFKLITQKVQNFLSIFRISYPRFDKLKLGMKVIPLVVTNTM
jgi:hypothetical protein